MVDESNATRASLILRIGAGDPEAWRLYVTIYTPKIEKWARRFGVRADDVDDVVQDVIKKVVQAAKKFIYDKDKGRYRGYLKTIAHRTAKDWLKKKSQQPKTNGQTDEPDPMSMVMDDAAGDSLLENLIEGERESRRFETEQNVRQQLNERAWQAYHQSVYLDKEPLEIASSLGVKVKHYYKLKCDFINRLRENLKEPDQ